MSSRRAGAPRQRRREPEPTSGHTDPPASSARSTLAQAAPRSARATCALSPTTLGLWISALVARRSCSSQLLASATTPVQGEMFRPGCEARWPSRRPPAGPPLRGGSEAVSRAGGCRAGAPGEAEREGGVELAAAIRNPLYHVFARIEQGEAGGGHGARHADVKTSRRRPRRRSCGGAGFLQRRAADGGLSLRGCGRDELILRYRGSSPGRRHARRPVMPSPR